MARKPETAPAEPTDAPTDVTRIISRERDGQHYPALAMTGDAPRKGSSLRVRLANGRVYTGKVAGHYDEGGQMFVETEGLTPEE